MRYWIGFVVALALVAAPLSASAQEANESESRLERWHPDAFESDGEEDQPGALRIEQNEQRLTIVSGTGQNRDLAPVSKEERRVRRARSGLIGSAIVTGVGGVLVVGGVVATTNCATDIVTSFESSSSCPGMGLYIAGATVGAGGVAGLLISGPILAVRKRQLRDAQAIQRTVPPRVRWNLARSRLEF